MTSLGVCLVLVIENITNDGFIIGILLIYLINKTRIDVVVVTHCVLQKGIIKLGVKALSYNPSTKETKEDLFL